MRRMNLPGWVPLAVLTAAFALSHAFRTVVTLAAGQMRPELQLSEEAIGIIAGSFHVAFGALQLLMGVALDLYGPRRVISVVFPASVVGALVCTLASGLPALVAGQLLIGMGCAPVFLAAMVLIVRCYPADQFARLSGVVLGLGGVGMLITGTPMAWIVETGSWRAAFLVLAAASAVIWVLAVALVPGQPTIQWSEQQPFRAALQQVKMIFAQKQTLGIVVLGAVTYASFISLRGLWLVPLLSDRHGYTLIGSGHVALAASIVTLLGPPLFGYIDPGGRSRRKLIVACTLAYAGMFALLAVGTTTVGDTTLTILAGLLAGYFVLQYADVRQAFPPAVSGSALAVFNTSLFLGVAIVQWTSGVCASISQAHLIEPLTGAFAIIAVLLVVAVVAFIVLPWPACMERRVASPQLQMREAKKPL